MGHLYSERLSATFCWAQNRVGQDSLLLLCFGELNQTVGNSRYETNGQGLNVGNRDKTNGQISNNWTILSSLFELVGREYSVGYWG